jgi:hypothetical protein
MGTALTGARRVLSEKCLGGVVQQRNLKSTIAFSVGIATFFIRYLTTGAIDNDHFVMLARAFQVLHGDWPVRDFEDPGQPLAYLVSTAAAALFGPTLLVNVVLCILFLSVTSALVYLLAFRATGSTWAGLLAAAMTVAIYPRMYNTTKVLVPVVAIWLSWRYADAPSARRLVLLAGWTAIAFLLRHDYVVYVAASNIVLLTMCHSDDRGEMIRRMASYAGLSLLFVSPWLLYVQWSEGIAEYFASAFRFVTAEGVRTAEGWPRSPLFYALVAIPVTGLLLSFRRRSRLSPAQLASASVLVLLIELVFLRDVLAARLPDVVAPIAVVAAAVAGQVLPSRVLNRALLATAVALLVLAAALAVLHPDRLPTLDTLARQPARVTRRLAQASPEIQPDPHLAPLVDYLARCTPRGDRVLVSGFGPEIPVLAHRAFAGGLAAWIPGYYDDPADIGRALARLNRERVAAAVMLDGSTDFRRSWPELDRWLQQRGWAEHAVPVIDSRLRVWLPRAEPTTPIDAPTALPCPSV